MVAVSVSKEGAEVTDAQEAIEEAVVIITASQLTSNLVLGLSQGIAINPKLHLEEEVVLNLIGMEEEIRPL